MRRRLSSTLLALVVALVALVGSARGAGQPIGKSTFEARVLHTPHVWLVEYMSPRCGTCQELAPVWRDFVARNGGKVKCGQVNIDDADGMALAQDHGVLEEGIPSIWAYDKSTGEATKVWGEFDIPKVADLEATIFENRLKHARTGSDGLLEKRG